MIWVLAWAIPAGLAIGMSLGALGGGGSVLTVPALVYLLHQNAHAATTASLIIVGLTAAAGAAGHWRAGRVKVAEGTVFGLLGVAGSYAGSRASAAVSQHVLLAAFAGLMVIAAGAMLRGRSAPAARPSPPAARGAASGAGVTAGRASAVPPARGGLPGPADGSGTAWRVRDGLRVAGAATVVGLLTGFFGVGGGFVIVPALVLALGFGMATAVGTSLLVIAISSAAALAARAGSGFGLDWVLVAAFSGAAIAGTLAGKRIADRVTGRALTVAFACLLAALASYMLARSLPALA